MKRLLLTLLLAALSAAAAAPPTVAPTSPWVEIIGPPQGVSRPAAPGPVIWRTNLTDALFEARQKNRPLFVTMRCLPCKQCADFDKAVLDGGPDLDPLLRHFITVRLTDARAMDLRVFPVDGFQDLDLSWWGWFLSPDAQVYGVFGGRDEVSDSTRISKAALIATLQRVVAHHYDARRLIWNAELSLDGPVPNFSPPTSTATNLAGFKSWETKAGPAVKNQQCLHCHQLNDILRQPALDAKLFNKQRHVEVWPLPENVGITLDRDHGLLVRAVAPDSAAARAGLRVGDVLAAAAGRRLFSQADFRGALQRGPLDAGEIEIWWLRGQLPVAASLPMMAKLLVAPGWRRTVLDWRMSISQGNIGAPPGFFPLGNVTDARRQQLGLAPGKMAISPYWGSQVNPPPARAGMRQTDVITAVDGQSPNLAGRAFLIWFRQNHEPGDKVTFTVKDAAGPDRQIVYQLTGAEF